MSEGMKLSVVMPAQNEEGSVGATVEGVVAALEREEPQPAGQAQKLAARRVEVVRERLTSAGADAKRLEAAAKPPAPDAKGDGRVEFAVVP